AVKANELAPGRFSWVKYKDQINIHTIKTHLWDAKSERKGILLLGSEKEGWMLTSSGMEIARSRMASLQGLKSKKRNLSESEKHWMRTERLRILGTEAYKKITGGRLDTVTLEEAESFFRLNAYVVGKAREQKIIRLLNLFGDDEQLGTVARVLAETVRSK